MVLTIYSYSPQLGLEWMIFFKVSGQLQPFSLCCPKNKVRGRDPVLPPVCRVKVRVHSSFVNARMVAALATWTSNPCPSYISTTSSTIVKGLKGVIFGCHSYVEDLVLWAATSPMQGSGLLVGSFAFLLRQHLAKTVVTGPKVLGVVPQPACHNDKCSAALGHPLSCIESFDAMRHRRSIGLPPSTTWKGGDDMLSISSAISPLRDLVAI